MKKSFFLFTLVFLLGCSDSKDDLSREIDTVILDDLIQHSNEFDKRVYSFDNGLHLAVGYGIANSIMVEGIDGNIIIDASDQYR